jgi:hypothetical protein
MFQVLVESGKVKYEQGKPIPLPGCLTMVQDGARSSFGVPYFNPRSAYNFDNELDEEVNALVRDYPGMPNDPNKITRRSLFVFRELREKIDTIYKARAKARVQV